MDEQVRELVERLEAIAAELDDVTFDRLREAVADGSGQRPAEDKQLVQARRALEKAIRLLAQVGGDPGTDDSWT